MEGSSGGGLRCFSPGLRRWVHLEQKSISVPQSREQEIQLLLSPRISIGRDHWDAHLFPWHFVHISKSQEQPGWGSIMGKFCLGPNWGSAAHRRCDLGKSLAFSVSLSPRWCSEDKKVYLIAIVRIKGDCRGPWRHRSRKDHWWRKVHQEKQRHPWGSLVKRSVCQSRRHGLDSWSGRIPRASEQLSPHATAQEEQNLSWPTHPAVRAPHKEKPPEGETPMPQLACSLCSQQWEKSPSSNEDPAQPKINK